MAEHLWDWSLRHYPEIEGLCLSLQDEAGFEVNTLLWALWCLERGYDPSPKTPDAARLALAWQASVGGLRQARRAMKIPPEGVDSVATEALRAEIKACELEAERLLQDALDTLGRGLLPFNGDAGSAYDLMQDLARALGADGHHPDLAIMVKAIVG